MDHSRRITDEYSLTWKVQLRGTSAKHNWSGNQKESADEEGREDIMKVLKACSVEEKKGLSSSRTACALKRHKHGCTSARAAQGASGKGTALSLRRRTELRSENCSGVQALLFKGGGY